MPIIECFPFQKAHPDLARLADEIDLAPGKRRVKSGGGHAGHNGLRSLHQHIGPDYARVRMGVGHPGHKDAVPGYVLKDFPKADLDWLDDMLRGCSDGAPALASGDNGRFQNAVALRLNPPRSGGGDKSPQAKAKPEPKPDAPKEAPKADDTRSPLQKLVDRFK